jgi:hypothetical protein
VRAAPEVLLLLVRLLLHLMDLLAVARALVLALAMWQVLVRVLLMDPLGHLHVLAVPLPAGGAP